MLKYLIPRFDSKELPAMFGVAVAGAVVAGCYGVVHDQITYTISPEYFTKLKFQQFSWANWGLGDRVLAGCVGFLATWWVGLIIGWFLARRLIPNHTRCVAYRKILVAFAIVLACGLVAGVSGFTVGIWRGPNADYSVWQRLFHLQGITNHWAFVRVAYIHNASYIGGIVGVIIALILVRPAVGERC